MKYVVLVKTPQLPHSWELGVYDDETAATYAMFGFRNAAMWQGHTDWVVSMEEREDE